MLHAAELKTCQERRAVASKARVELRMPLLVLRRELEQLAASQSSGRRLVDVHARAARAKDALEELLGACTDVEQRSRDGAATAAALATPESEVTHATASAECSLVEQKAAAGAQAEIRASLASEECEVLRLAREKRVASTEAPRRAVALAQCVLAAARRPKWAACRRALQNELPRKLRSSIEVLDAIEAAVEEQENDGLDPATADPGFVDERERCRSMAHDATERLQKARTLWRGLLPTIANPNNNRDVLPMSRHVHPVDSRFSSTSPSLSGRVAGDQAAAMLGGAAVLQVLDRRTSQRWTTPGFSADVCAEQPLSKVQSAIAAAATAVVSFCRAVEQARDSHSRATQQSGMRLLLRDRLRRSTHRLREVTRDVGDGHRARPHLELLFRHAHDTHGRALGALNQHRGGAYPLKIKERDGGDGETRREAWTKGWEGSGACASTSTLESAGAPARVSVALLRGLVEKAEGAVLAVQQGRSEAVEHATQLRLARATALGHVEELQESLMRLRETWRVHAAVSIEGPGRSPSSLTGQHVAVRPAAASVRVHATVQAASQALLRAKALAEARPGAEAAAKSASIVMLPPATSGGGSTGNGKNLERGGSMLAGGTLISKMKTASLRARVPELRKAVQEAESLLAAARNTVRDVVAAVKLAERRRETQLMELRPAQATLHDIATALGLPSSNPGAGLPPGQQVGGGTKKPTKEMEAQRCLEADAAAIFRARPHLVPLVKSIVEAVRLTTRCDEQLSRVYYAGDGVGDVSSLPRQVLGARQTEVERALDAVRVVERLWNDVHQRDQAVRRSCQHWSKSLRIADAALARELDVAAALGLDCTRPALRYTSPSTYEPGDASKGGGAAVSAGEGRDVETTGTSAVLHSARDAVRSASAVLRKGHRLLSGQSEEEEEGDGRRGKAQRSLAPAHLVHEIRTAVTVAQRRCTSAAVAVRRAVAVKRAANSAVHRLRQQLVAIARRHACGTLLGDAGAGKDGAERFDLRSRYAAAAAAVRAAHAAIGSSRSTEQNKDQEDCSLSAAADDDVDDLPAGSVEASARENGGLPTPESITAAQRALSEADRAVHDVESMLMLAPQSGGVQLGESSGRGRSGGENAGGGGRQEDRVKLLEPVEELLALVTTMDALGLADQQHGWSDLRGERLKGTGRSPTLEWELEVGMGGEGDGDASKPTVFASPSSASSTADLESVVTFARRQADKAIRAAREIAMSNVTMPDLIFELDSVGGFDGSGVGEVDAASERNAGGDLGSPVRVPARVVEVAVATAAARVASLAQACTTRDTVLRVRQEAGAALRRAKLRVQDMCVQLVGHCETLEREEQLAALDQAQLEATRRRVVTTGELLAVQSSGGAGADDANGDMDGKAVPSLAILARIRTQFAATRQQVLRAGLAYLAAMRLVGGVGASGSAGADDADTNTTAEWMPQNAERRQHTMVMCALQRLDLTPAEREMPPPNNTSDNNNIVAQAAAIEKAVATFTSALEIARADVAARASARRRNEAATRNVRSKASVLAELTQALQAAQRGSAENARRLQDLEVLAATVSADQTTVIAQNPSRVPAGNIAGEPGQGVSQLRVAGNGDPDDDNTERPDVAAGLRVLGVHAEREKAARADAEAAIRAARQDMWAAVEASGSGKHRQQRAGKHILMAAAEAVKAAVAATATTKNMAEAQSRRLKLWRRKVGQHEEMTRPKLMQYIRHCHGERQEGPHRRWADNYEAYLERMQQVLPGDADESNVDAGNNDPDEGTDAQAESVSRASVEDHSKERLEVGRPGLFVPPVPIDVKMARQAAAEARSQATTARHRAEASKYSGVKYSETAKKFVAYVVSPAKTSSCFSSSSFFTASSASARAQRTKAFNEHQRKRTGAPPAMYELVGYFATAYEAAVAHDAAQLRRISARLGREREGALLVSSSSASRLRRRDDHRCRLGKDGRSEGHKSIVFTAVELGLSLNFAKRNPSAYFVDPPQTADLKRSLEAIRSPRPLGRAAEDGMMPALLQDPEDADGSGASRGHQGGVSIEGDVNNNLQSLAFDAAVNVAATTSQYGDSTEDIAHWSGLADDLAARTAAGVGNFEAGRRLLRNTRARVNSNNATACSRDASDANEEVEVNEEEDVLETEVEEDQGETQPLFQRSMAAADIAKAAAANLPPPPPQNVPLRRKFLAYGFGAQSSRRRDPALRQRQYFLRQPEQPEKQQGQARSSSRAVSETTEFVRSYDAVELHAWACTTRRSRRRASCRKKLAAERCLTRGARVRARFADGERWFKGVIMAVNRADGHCDIAYDEGDWERRVPPHLVRVLKPKKKETTTTVTKEATRGVKKKEARTANEATSKQSTLSADAVPTTESNGFYEERSTEPMSLPARDQEQEQAGSKVDVELEAALLTKPIAGETTTEIGKKSDAAINSIVVEETRTGGKKQPPELSKLLLQRKTWKHALTKRPDKHMPRLLRRKMTTTTTTTTKEVGKPHGKQSAKSVSQSSSFAGGAGRNARARRYSKRGVGACDGKRSTGNRTGSGAALHRGGGSGSGSGSVLSSSRGSSDQQVAWLSRVQAESRRTLQADL